MTVAAAAVFALPDVPWVSGALTGLQMAVVGLLAAAFWRLARSEARSVALILVLLAAFGLGLFMAVALQVFLPLLLVQEIRAASLLPKENPVATRSLGRNPLLHKGAKRRDARARANHDAILRRVLGQPKMRVRNK